MGAKTDTSPEKIKRLLSFAVEEVFVKDSLEKKLLSGIQLRVKLGFDPTSPHIHLGRAIILRKLREFQDLGHIAIFIAGDFTAKIGDPSDKLEKRPMLSDKDIKNNLKTYKTQVGKIIDIKKAEFHFNSKWLSKLSFADVAELAEGFSIQQMSHRRNFAERINRGEEISLREFLYPLMQGYDSVATKADVEIGGFDQLFNLKAGRVIQRHFRLPEQDVLTTKMLPGTDGRKMSSSWGNIVSIDDEPKDMYGKVMSLHDDLITAYSELCADFSEKEILTTKESLKDGNNPRDAKMKLAFEIVRIYHGEKFAKEAENNFIKTFQKGGVPEDILEMSANPEDFLSDVLINAKVLGSKSEWKRLVEQKGIQTEPKETISDPFLKVGKGGIFRIGKRRFVKIRAN